MSLCLWRSVDVAKKDFEDDYNGYVSSVHTLSYIAIAFFFGLCMIFKTQVQDFCQMDDLMFYTCFLYVFTYTSMLYVQRRDKQVLKYKFSTMATLLTIVPGTFLSIWLIYRGRVQGLIGQLVDRRAYRILCTTDYRWCCCCNCYLEHRAKSSLFKILEIRSGIPASRLFQKPYPSRL